MALARLIPDASGLGVWLALILGALLLPGAHWRLQASAAFPWMAGLIWLGTMGLLGMLLGLLLVGGGPRLGRGRVVALVGTLPEVVLGGALLLLWPRGWGAPGTALWSFALLVVLLPGEWRWLAQGMPQLPMPYGSRVARRARWKALGPLLRHWASVRWPVLLMGSLIVERVLGCVGPASDFAARLSARDRLGSVLWILGLTVCWWLGRRCAR